MMGLALIFALTAVLYASAGFGGGSTYTALLALSGADYRVLPIVSLCCNLVVVTGGVIHFARASVIPWRRALPLCVLSVPLAWLGGALQVPETLFVGLLASSLFVAGCLLLAGPPASEEEAPPKLAGAPSHVVEIAIGGGLGLLSGMVGIGGGIFLSPILHLMRWAPARAIAGTASLFILLNSTAGLLGQMTKADGAIAEAALGYWPLLLAVLIAGQVGSRLGVALLPEIWLRRLTAVLVLAVAIRLFVRVFDLMASGA